MGSIYVIKNKINNKMYIGQTTQNVNDRFKQHLKLLSTSKKQMIYKAIKKYGKENFVCEVLEENIPIKLLDEKEEYYINLYDTFNNGYNLCKGGKQSRKPKMFSVSEENEIIRLYKLNNISIREIARRYNVTHNTISNLLKHNNIQIVQRNKSSKNLKQEDKEYISLLYTQNKSIKEIIALTGFNERTIYRYTNV